MKRLTVLRHAKSSWDDPVERDFDRPLNRKGLKAAQAMGAYMREHELRFDHVIASPAVRVTETLVGVAQSYGEEFDLTEDRRVYLASNMTLVDIVHEVDGEVESLLLAGHNSGLEDLVMLLAADRKGDKLLAAVEEKYPTGALAEIEFDAASWADIEPGSGVLTRFVRPRDLDDELGPDEPT
ncbi:MAG: histidine phosphatase family protein [Sphingomonadaceae bacterium]|nr:histidine phosphatase family protein [Sphingomonadaceae bacterium]